MTKNPLISRIRRHLPQFSKAEFPPSIETLSLGQLLDMEALATICCNDHSDHRDNRLRVGSTRRLVPQRRRSTKPIPASDHQETPPFGEGLVQFSAALQIILNDYYPRLGEKTPLARAARISPRNLAKLLAPLKRHAPKKSDTGNVNALTFREYFGEVLAEEEQIVLFPVNAYEKVKKLYPFPARWPEVGGIYRDELRLSLAAVWEYYKSNGLGSDDLLDSSLEGIAEFLQPLTDDFICYYPTGAWLESICEDGHEEFWSDREQFVMTYPYVHGDSEEAECVIAFLEGPESVAAYAERTLEQMGHDFLLQRGVTQADLDLVKEQGLLGLVQGYAASDQGRTIPMNKLANYWDAYFGQWHSDYSHSTGQYLPEIIAYDDMSILPETGRDIQMLKDYCLAFDRLLGDMPLFTSDWREDDFVEFLRELCRVARMGNTDPTTIKIETIEEDQRAA